MNTILGRALDTLLIVPPRRGGALVLKQKRQQDKEATGKELLFRSCSKRLRTYKSATQEQMP